MRKGIITQIGTEEKCPHCGNKMRLYHDTTEGDDYFLTCAMCGFEAFYGNFDCPKKALSSLETLHENINYQED